MTSEEISGRIRNSTDWNAVCTNRVGVPVINFRKRNDYHPAIQQRVLVLEDENAPYLGYRQGYPFDHNYSSLVRYNMVFPPLSEFTLETIDDLVKALNELNRQKNLIDNYEYQIEEHFDVSPINSDAIKYDIATLLSNSSTNGFYVVIHRLVEDHLRFTGKVTNRTYFVTMAEELAEEKAQELEQFLKESGRSDDKSIIKWFDKKNYQFFKKENATAFRNNFVQFSDWHIAQCLSGAFNRLDEEKKIEIAKLLGVNIIYDEGRVIAPANTIDFLSKT